MSTSASTKKVLIVDDDPSIVDLIVSQLEPKGLLCEGISSGRKALKRLSEEEFDLVILDAVLPDLNGQAVSCSIRKNQSSVNLPILIVSAFFRRNRDQQELIDAWGVQGFMPKPFSEADLLEEVERILGKLESVVPSSPTIKDLQADYLVHLNDTLVLWNATLDDEKACENSAAFFEDLEMKAHQIKGSAGSYGFPELSVLADQLESLSRNCRQAPTKVTSLEWGRVRYLVRSFDKNLSQINSEKCAELANGKSKIVYLGADEVFFQQLKSCPTTKEYRVEHCQTMTETIGVLRANQVESVILDLDGFHDTADEMMPRIREAAGIIGANVCCVSSSADTMTRVLALRLEADQFHSKADPIEALTIAKDCKTDCPNPNKRRILAVDDDRFTLLYLKRVLSDSDWSIEVVESPNDLIKRAQEWNPEIILLDFEMPGVKGYELCQVIKTDRKLSHIPTVILSAHDDEAFRIQALRAGAVGYIKKWPSVPELKMQIANLLDRQAAPSEPKAVVTPQPLRAVS